MPKRTFTIEETSVLRTIVDQEILRRSKGSTADSDQDPGEAIIGSLAPLFVIREKLSTKPAAVKTAIARSQRCAEKKGRRRCDLSVNHPGEHVSDGVPFSAQAGWLKETA